MGNTYTFVVVEFEDYPSIQLAFEGDVVVGAPRSVDFGTIKRGEASVRSFRLTPLAEGSLEIQGLEFNEEHFDVSYTQTDSLHGHVFLFEVRATQDIPFGPFSETLTIRTSDQYLAQKAIELRGYVEERVEFEPEALVLGALTPGESTQIALRVYSPYSEPLEVKAIDHGINEDSLSYEVLPGGDDGVTINFVFVPTSTEATRVVKREIILEILVDGEPVTRVVELYALIRSPSNPAR